VFCELCVARVVRCMVLCVGCAVRVTHDRVWLRSMRAAHYVWMYVLCVGAGFVKCMHPVFERG